MTSAIVLDLIRGKLRNARRASLRKRLCRYALYVSEDRNRHRFLAAASDAVDFLTAPPKFGASDLSPHTLDRVCGRFGDLTFEPEEISLSSVALTQNFLIAATRLRAAPPLVKRRYDFGAAQTKFFGYLYLPRYRYGPVALLSPFGFTFIDVPPLNGAQGLVLCADMMVPLGLAFYGHCRNRPAAGR